MVGIFLSTIISKWHLGALVSGVKLWLVCGAYHLQLVKKSKMCESLTLCPLML